MSNTPGAKSQRSASQDLSGAKSQRSASGDNFDDKSQRSASGDNFDVESQHSALETILCQSQHSASDGHFGDNARNIASDAEYRGTGIQNGGVTTLRHQKRKPSFTYVETGPFAFTKGKLRRIPFCFTPPRFKNTPNALPRRW